MGDGGEGVGVDVVAEALAVGSAGSGVVKATFVPLQTEPEEVVLDHQGILKA